MPPGRYVKEVLDELESSDGMLHKSDKIMFLGDLNLDFLKPNHKTDLITDILDSFALV